MPYYTFELFVPKENLTVDEVRRNVEGALHAKDPSVHVVALTKRKDTFGLEWQVVGEPRSS